MAEGELPQLRASDADRERVAEVLRRAAGEGRLTVQELDERLDRAYASRTRAELAPVARRGARRLRPQGALAAGRAQHERQRHGRQDLDLTQVEVASDQVELTVVAIMAGSDVRVPEGLNVEVSELALLGGNSSDVGETRPAPGGPMLRLRLLSIMGGIDVKRGPKRSRAER